MANLKTFEPRYVPSGKEYQFTEQWTFPVVLVELKVTEGFEIQSVIIGGVLHKNHDWERATVLPHQMVTAIVANVAFEARASEPGLLLAGGWVFTPCIETGEDTPPPAPTEPACPEAIPTEPGDVQDSAPDEPLHPASEPPKAYAPPQHPPAYASPGYVSPPHAPAAAYVPPKAEPRPIPAQKLPAPKQNGTVIYSVACNREQVRRMLAACKGAVLSPLEVPAIVSPLRAADAVPKKAGMNEICFTLSKEHVEHLITAVEGGTMPPLPAGIDIIKGLEKAVNSP